MSAMSYFGFLARFLGIPIVLLAVVAVVDRQRGRKLPEFLSSWPAWAAVFLHVLVALVYTTPWDNYLVATGVWWYNPELVTGIRLGWVPLEEYTFFVLQTLLAGLWLVFLARRLRREPARRPTAGRLRVVAPFLLAVPWLGSVAVLLSGWQPGTYLALELVWALPPIALQLAFGADILWRHRRLIGWALAPLVLYLSLADSLAIGGGTWTINPELSLSVLLGGVLPVEELIFFLLTNTLLVFGIFLLLARESRERVAFLRRGLLRLPASR